MKKKLCVLLFVLVLASQVWAKGIGYGPKVGGSFSFISNLDRLPLVAMLQTEATLFDIARTSPHWGGYFEYALTEQLSIGAEMLYTRVGSIYQGPDREYALRTSYINIPIWVMFHPLQLKPGFGIYLGPALNALWHAVPKNLGLYNCEIIKEKHVDSFTWAVVGGGCYQSFFGLCVDLRYNWGLTDIYYFRGADARPDFIKGITFASHVLQLSLAYNLATLLESWPPKRVEETKRVKDSG